MKKTISLALVGVSVLVSACRFDIAAPTVLVGDGENVEIVRSMSADSQLPVNQTTTIYACVAAPTSWGDPLSVTISGTESSNEPEATPGTPFVETPGVLAERTDAMQASFPLPDHTWRCYKSPAKSYSSVDSGQIALTFDADTERALVLSTLAEDDSATDGIAALDNLAVQDVIRGATYPTGTWAPVEVTIQNPESGERILFNVGEYDGREVLLSNVTGFLTTPDAPSSLYFFNSATDIEVENAGYGVGSIEARSDRMVAILVDPMDGETYVGVRTTVSDDWVLQEEPLPPASWALATDESSGDYVLFSPDEGSVSYSADGMTWTEGPDTGLAGVSRYASNSAAQVVLGNSDVDDGLLAVRTAEVWEPTLTDWFVEGINSDGDALYVVISDEPGSMNPYDESGNLVHLLRSTDGQTWTKVMGSDEEYSGFVILSFNGKSLMTWQGGFYTSDNNGVAWAELDMTGLPIVTDAVVDIHSSGVAAAGEGAILEIGVEPVLPEGEEVNVYGSGSIMVYTTDFENFEVIGSDTALSPVEIDGKAYAYGFDTEGFQLFSFNAAAGGKTSGSSSAVVGSSSSGGAFLLLPMLWLLLVRRR